MVKGKKKEKKAIKRFSDLPAWYRRIMSRPGVCEGTVDVNPMWFDEDISDLEEKPFKCRCDAAEYSDVVCWCDSDDRYDSVSERSYQDDDADCFYEMKEQREERKSDLKRDRELFEKEKKAELRFHKRKVEEVRAVYEALKEKEKAGDHSPITFLEDSEYVTKLKKAGKKVPPYLMPKHKTFNLYCADYVENCYHDDTGTYWRYVEFNEDEFDDKKGAKRSRGSVLENEVTGHVYVNCNNQLDFSTFVVPDHASTKTYWSDAYRGKYKAAIQFIGQDYARMTVSRDIIEATESDPLPASCPKVFEFMGINRYSPKLVAEEEEDMKKRIAARSQ
ncbi:uncharacterized protein GGS22DRAFT_196015 [Annulohypoxylon maeteangense]|uniref:uncharacterized protein n=1 Tax=Annulohypoxylon maeteangense TaxID=1927788 RepID=UPI0020073674|nr:uncharacterized protein GGS22DRAFT_196015 [Annulohypoxylon maeteangense]KAI0882311.1 hypothetical protein GGS22DRAFT_196015 [Annulohypoxylon maeteangense]